MASKSEILHPTRSRRVVRGFESHLGLAFFRVPSGFYQHFISYVFIILTFVNLFVDLLLWPAYCTSRWTVDIPCISFVVSIKRCLESSFVCLVMLLK